MGLGSWRGHGLDQLGDGTWKVTGKREWRKRVGVGGGSGGEEEVWGVSECSRARRQGRVDGKVIGGRRWRVVADAPSAE